MKPSLSGRADLIRALACHDPALTAAMAELLGYQPIPMPLREPALSPEGLPPQTQTKTTVSEEAPYEPVDVPFWRLEAYEAAVLDDEVPETSTRTVADPLWRHRPSATPGFVSLAPKRVILTRLRQVSATRRTTRDVDVESVVERLSRGDLLDEIPRRQRRAWGAEIYIIEDRARRLAPYWLDQEYVTDVLKQIYPPSGVTIARLSDNDNQPFIRWPEERRGRPAAPLPGTLVLVLGDLGCLAMQGEHLHRFWMRWGRQLRDNQNPAIALVPARTRDIPPDLARLWTIVRWDVGTAITTDIQPISAATAVRRLLILLSPVVRLEPGLLRAVRCLLPEGRSDAGLESRVWQDAAIISQHLEAATFDPDQRKAYLQHFSSESETLRRLVLDLVREWRANLNAAVWFEEIIGLDSDSKRQQIHAADLEDAVAYLTLFADESLLPEDISVETAAWICRLVERLPETAIDHPRVKRAVHRMYDFVRPRAAESPAPTWYDPAVASPAGQTVRQAELWQVADRLLLQMVEPSAPLGHRPVQRGSPLGVVHTASGEVKIAIDAGERSRDDFWQTGRPPIWARQWGNDAFGPWVTFRIGDVEQRLRWIPPGRFRMGSPVDEDGRYDNEGPVTRWRSRAAFGSSTRRARRRCGKR